MRSFDLSPLFRSSVGFDQLDKLLDAAFREGARDTSYPPYNIVKVGDDRYRVTMAVAGFAENDLDITMTGGMLIVKGQIRNPDKDVEYLHRGIAQRAFEHRFQLADHVRVESAALRNGLLDVELKREIPEAMKPRKISIGEGASSGTGDTSRPTVIEGEKSRAA
ncbi:MAG: Hsp20 family protein [Geminicoccaceae bacterium]|nr:Hsp20 family protein [Geminicoccaceae bacterium]